MRDKAKARQLQEIRALRELQRLKAEKQAIEAAHDLRQSQDRMQDEQTLLSQTAADWQTAILSADPCDPAFRLRGAALVKQIKVARAAEAEVADAQTLHAAAMEAWNTSMALHRLAHDSCRKVMRRVALKTGDLALEEATDLFVSREKPL